MDVDTTAGWRRSAMMREEMYDFTRVERWVFSAWDWSVGKAVGGMMGLVVGEMVSVGVRGIPIIGLLGEEY
jgi:hypothetical protein